VLIGGKMVTITPDQITVYGIIGSLILLAIIIYFTRAKSRRIVGAIVGGLVVGLLIILIDWTASSLGYNSKTDLQKLSES
jgi:H+/Cl- antiporter ClcA